MEISLYGGELTLSQIETFRCFLNGFFETDFICEFHPVTGKTIFKGD